jgi:hypothetical protein
MIRRTLLLSFVLVLVNSGAAAGVPRLYALTAESPRLISFNADAPGTVLSSVPVLGLDAGETLHGMDVRPANNTFVLLTSQGLRTLDPITGGLSLPVALAGDPADASDPFVGFDASQGVGVDVNPVPDRLRVVTGVGESMRINMANGLVTTDSDLNPGSPQVVAVAYTNPFPGAISTTLYDFDTAADQMAIQNPPNNGTLTALTGPFGMAVGGPRVASMEIAPGDNATAYMSATTGAPNQLIRIDLTTGVGTVVGTINELAPIAGIAAQENVVFADPAVVGANEADGTATVTVRRDGPRSSTTVHFATADGTAVAGTHYAATSGDLTFAEGETVKTVQVPLIADAAGDQSRTFSVALSNVVPAAQTNARLIAPSSTTVAIVDKADPPAPVPTPAPTPSPTAAPPPTALPRDTTAPTLLVTASPPTRARLRSRGLKLTYSCSEACRVTSKLLIGSRTGGTATSSLTKAGLGTLTVKLSKAGRAALGRKRRVSVSTVATDAAGLRTTYRFSVRVG